MSQINKINRVVISEDILFDIDDKVKSSELQNALTIVNNRIEEINSNLGVVDKPPVATYDDIATIYPDPQQGWRVKTEDNGYTYQYDENNGWYLVTLFPVPEASEQEDGLLSKEDKAKLNTIETGAQKNLTPQETLDNIKTVDGVNSGLDADTVDGKHASDFASTIHSHDGLYYRKNEVDVKVNSKANANTLTTHINDNEKHITPEDRVEWDSGIIKIGTTPPESGFLFWLDTNSED